MLAAIDIEQGLEDAWEATIVIVPKLLGFLVILLLGWIIAKALAKLVDRLLERVGFDGWVERGMLRTTFERSKLDASDIIAMIVFWGLFLVVLQLAFGVWGPNPISDLLYAVISYLPNILVAVLILVIAGAIARGVTDLLDGMLSAVSSGRWIARVAGVAILVIGVFAALNQLQIAPWIVTGVFYAMLAIIVGSAIVAIGGGGIRTMQTYWDRSARNLESTSHEISATADAEAGKAAVQRRVEEERARMEGSTTTETPPIEIDITDDRADVPPPPATTTS
jgi:hypothetical protein